MEFLTELFRRTAQRVFRDIYEHLKHGDLEPLVEHWTYYYGREGGKFDVVRTDDQVDFKVMDCPAVRHLKERGVPIDDAFYLQISLLNSAWAEETPFTIETDILGEGVYTMRLRRRQHASE